MKKISIVSVLIKKKLKKYKSIPLIATMVIFTLFLTSSLVFAEDSLSSNSEQITEKSDSNSSKQEQTNQSITPSLSETKESSENPKIESYNSLNKTPFGISNGHYFNYLPDLYKYNGLVINTPAYFEGEWPPYNSIYTGEYGIDYFDGSNGDLGTDWQYQYAQIAGVGSKFLLPEAVKMMYRTMPYQVSADMSKFLGYQPSGFVYRQKLDLNRKQVMGFYYRSSLDGPGFTATLHNDTDFSPSNVNELSDPLKATIFGPIGGGGFGFGAYPLTHEERAFATKTSGTNQLRLWGLNDWNGGNSGKKYETQFIENAISIGYAQISANKNAFLFSIPIVSYNYNLTGTSFGNQYGLPKRFTKVTIPNQVGSNSLSINELSVKAIEQPMYYRYVGMKIEDNLPNPEGTTSENQSIQPDLVDTMWTGDNTNPKYITFIYEPINPTSADFEKPFSGALKVNQIGKVD